ncbi:hypothetical protein [Nostoc sp. PCC 7120 = FACHB-418]|uniref:hypothetical protein n=1 Tax=Nostoc sp. (strain PCC 7120 / SAG 25.82 / UTEX 2576) TaxID=103690 RepID=UPI000F8E4BF0|nr:hypothetical protein [Nostoc sp. PCC 7120 = FACHB-418]
MTDHRSETIARRTEIFDNSTNSKLKKECDRYTDPNACPVLILYSFGEPVPLRGSKLRVASPKEKGILLAQAFSTRRYALALASRKRCRIGITQL